MSIYKTICYKVEDVFVAVIGRKQDKTVVKQKVVSFRNSKEEHKNKKRKQHQARV